MAKNGLDKAIEKAQGNLGAIAKGLELLTELEEAGLQERLGKPTLQKALENADQIIRYVDDFNFDRDPHIGDDFIVEPNIYNMIGAIYPSLSREKKDKALAAIIPKMDKVRYDYVQANHIPYIHEPLLQADLFIVRRLYWCGLDESKSIIQSYKSFEDLKKDLIAPDGMFIPGKLSSDFCVAYALLRSDMSPHEFFTKYATVANHIFLDRVVKATVAMRFGAEGLTEEKIRARDERLRGLLPNQLHPQIDKYFKERDWAKQSNFSK